MKDSISKFLHELGIDDYFLVPLKGDGSVRRFFRLFLPNKETRILILPQPGEFGLREAASYAAIGQYLYQHWIPVPRIYAYDEDSGFLLIEDLGEVRLQDLPPKERFFMYKRVIVILFMFQEAVHNFDLQFCLETTRYDQYLMWEKEALYFVDFFLRRFLKLDPSFYLLDELKAICKEAEEAFTDIVLLHRDFQSRNIMIKGGTPYIIDFQGLRLGPPSYDLASLLVDPYVVLTLEEKDYLFKQYLDISGRRVDDFEHEFRYLILFRNLQILGAFAKLSFMGKRWFVNYIPRAIQSLREIVSKFFPGKRHLIALLADLS